MKQVTAFIFILFAAWVIPTPAHSLMSMKADALMQLDTIRNEKKEQLLCYLNELNSKAEMVATDKAMNDFFHIKQTYCRLKKKSPPPETLAESVSLLKERINSHYLQNYKIFYDILFIDTNGDIFYTIRKQADYKKNIFSGALAETSLARKLREHPEKTFVDYQYYAVSKEPSAFIVKPIYNGHRLSGWFALQCASNKINSIFSCDNPEMGTTGEVFLVNSQHYMLTDSRFYGDSSILKRHLSRSNIETKFRLRSGHRTVTDYRGFKALTSFEVFTVDETEWLIVAKIDEEEIISDLYRKKPLFFQTKLLDYFNHAVPEPCRSETDFQDAVIVDMDENKKAPEGRPICTYGVSTCTAVIVSFPGKFAYMGHISSLDVAYGQKTTDIIGNIIKKIRNFDIYQYELRQLNITIAAPHLESVFAITDRFLKENIFLSQIRFMYFPGAAYGNVYHDCTKNITTVDWILNKDTGERISQLSTGTPTISECMLTFYGDGPLKTAGK